MVFTVSYHEKLTIRLHNLLHRADDTRFKVETAVHVAIVGFQIGLYYVVAPLSFPRTISLASLFAMLSKATSYFCPEEMNSLVM